MQFYRRQKNLIRHINPFKIKLIQCKLRSNKPPSKARFSPSVEYPKSYGNILNFKQTNVQHSGVRWQKTHCYNYKSFLINTQPEQWEPKRKINTADGSSPRFSLVCQLLFLFFFWFFVFVFCLCCVIDSDNNEKKLRCHFDLKLRLGWGLRGISEVVNLNWQTLPGHFR